MYIERQALIDEAAAWASLLDITLQLDYIWNDQIILSRRGYGMREVKVCTAEQLRREVVKLYHDSMEK